MARSGKYQPRPGSDKEQTTSGKSANKASRRETARVEMLRAQAAARRRNRLLTAGAVILAIVVVVGVAVGIFLSVNNNNDTASGSASTKLDPKVASAVTNIPANVFNSVGNGGGAVEAKPNPIQGQPLTADGKPRVLYVGAEYCPYCAAERWAMVAALSRFGTFSDLGQTTSSASDVYPSTATLSFHGATYSSQYLSFTGVEQTTNQPDSNSALGYTPLDTLSSADQQILATYDTKQYTGSDGGIPFIAFGGKYVSSGASYDPGVLKGLSHQQIAQDLSDPSSPVAKAIVGTANTLTSNLCTLTDQKPASVCTSPGVRAAAS